MTMTQEAALSGVDPFATDSRHDQVQDLEQVWFDAPASSRRVSVRPPSSSAPPAPIGDNEADRWFR